MTQGQSTAVRAVERQRAKQDKIIATAMEHFAVHGYEGARAEAIAAAAGVSKGAIFSYFGNKAGLFLAAYQAATRTFSKYLEAPPEILEQGFFATISYWLAHTPHMIHEDWIPYRVVLIGSYCTDLQLMREIGKYMRREDPYGTRAFVEFGVERGEVRRDIEIELIISLVDWLIDRCQDAIVTEELDPGLFGYFTQSKDLRERRVNQFVELLRSAISEKGSIELWKHARRASPCPTACGWRPRCTCRPTRTPRLFLSYLSTCRTARTTPWRRATTGSTGT
jgi:AcrR family transcriptional regulator